METVIDGIF